MLYSNLHLLFSWEDLNCPMHFSWTKYYTKYLYLITDVVRLFLNSYGIESKQLIFHHGFIATNPETWHENRVRPLALAWFSQQSTRDAFHINHVSANLMNKMPVNHWICVSDDEKSSMGMTENDVYKRDLFLTLCRFHNRACQPQRRDRLSDTSGIFWIHGGALTNQQCWLATELFPIMCCCVTYWYLCDSNFVTGSAFYPSRARISFI